jgi:GNAT superfamily N-acetyltransferase
MTAVPELEIVPLTPARLPDLAVLFGQGGDPKWCWCSYYRVRGVVATHRADRVAANRAVLEEAVAILAAEDRAPGLVAYRDSEAIGWVSLGPREDYQRLEHSTVLKRLDDSPVWSIVCFVVARKARRQGVARALLDAAVAYAREHGATLLEAYPVDTGGRRIPSAYAFSGALSMYERAGFEIVARRQYSQTSPVRPIVRRAVRRSGRRRRSATAPWRSGIPNPNIEPFRGPGRS